MAKTATRLSHSITAALADWLDLVGGPPSPTFTATVAKSNWVRLLKLVFLSVALSGAVLGLSAGVSSWANLPKNMGDSLLTSRPAVIVLLIGVILATSYSEVSKLFRIKISLAQSFFVILLIWIPWLPVLACFEAVKYLPTFPLIGVVYVLGPVLILIKPLNNFARGISEIAQCPQWRVWISVLLPLAFLCLLVYFMYK